MPVPDDIRRQLVPQVDEREVEAVRIVGIQRHSAGIAAASIRYPLLPCVYVCPAALGYLVMLDSVSPTQYVFSSVS